MFPYEIARADYCDCQARCADQDGKFVEGDVAVCVQRAADEAWDWASTDEVVV